YVDWTPAASPAADSLEGHSFNWSWRRAYDAEIPEAFTRRIKSFLHTVLESKAEHKGWKIPETTLCFPWIYRLFPDAKYIFWIRNPRDCIIGGHVTDDLCNFGIPYDRIFSDRGRRAVSWLYQYKLVQSAPRPKNWIEVRMEDFVLKQEETLSRLEEFLGFPLARIPVKPEAVGRYIEDEKDDTTDPNYFPVFEEAMREYGYEVPTTYKTALLNISLPVNYDTAKIPEYTLPDLLTMNDGTAVKSPEQWPARRKEIMDVLSTQEYGKLPEGKADVAAELIEGGSAFNDKAIREQVKLTFSFNPGNGVKKHSINLLIYRPAAAVGKVPAFLGLNFHGNHTVANDECILINDCCKALRVNRLETAENKGRGTYEGSWCPELLIDNGFALVTANYEEISPDYHCCFHKGVHTLFQNDDWTRLQPDEWAAIGAWAWGLGRIMDYLVTTDWLAADKVSVIGHSRLGKTALWAAANDTRFAIAYSIQSGCGGASLAKHFYGENINAITRNFRHWFCQNYNQYANNEQDMPFDQHFLLASIAPRPLYVSSATKDHWADQKGEFLALRAADKAYNLLGKKGLDTDDMPTDEHTVGAYNGYHIKEGPHSVTQIDWENYIAFARRHFGL
ncbi:MAG: sulfotransferase, partial [Victivallales bacterium]|nr:sulfotransferase [Victivallales bacterium]